MIKENKLKLVSPSTVSTTRTIPKAPSTTLFSIVVSISVIASISVIGIAFAYVLSHSSTGDTLDMKGKCISNIYGYEQKGYYANLEEYKAALASCIS
jgi:hypothetical protein